MVAEGREKEMMVKGKNPNYISIFSKFFNGVIKRTPLKAQVQVKMLFFM